MFDLLIKNGVVVNTGEQRRLDVGIAAGKIVALDVDLSDEQGERVIDADGMLVLPGCIDAHTHMGIPIMGTRSSDDFETGSIAAAMGGVTTIVDFTVQDGHATLQDAVDERLRLAECSHVDFALHVNVTHNPLSHLDEIGPLCRDGFCHFKMFTTYAAAQMMATWDELRQIMAEVHAHRGTLFLHAEDDTIVESATSRHVQENRREPIWHARSRPPEAEAVAITRAAEIAGELDATLYVVHVSSQAGLQAGLAARQRGVKVFLETCPQYLVLNESRYQGPEGHLWITTPPLRTEQDAEALWHALAAGEIDVVATDHCPFTREQKSAADGVFHATPNGLPGTETLLPLLYTVGVSEGRISLQQLVRVLCQHPAEIFGLNNKGKIAPGADADIVIYSPQGQVTWRDDRLHSNVDWNPYAGLKAIGNVHTTILRGQELVSDGRFTGDKCRGRLQRSGSVA